MDVLQRADQDLAQVGGDVEVLHLDLRLVDDGLVEAPVSAAQATVESLGGGNECKCLGVDCDELAGQSGGDDLRRRAEVDGRGAPAADLGQ